MRDNQMDGTPMTAALPASSPSRWRRVIFMPGLASKIRVSARVARMVADHENGAFAQVSLTFLACGGLRRHFIGKSFFSTRRPALEAGGQRPTARCALGRESVWNVGLGLCRDITRSSSPAKAG